MVHREDQEKSNMKFKVHESGIHCYNPTDKSVVLINNVSGSKHGFPNKQINGAEKTKKMYSKLGYPSVKNIRQIFQNKQIICCPVTVQDIDILHAIWGNNIEALKGNTNRKKQIHTTGDIVEIPKEIVKLHTNLFMTEKIFFVNGILFFNWCLRRSEERRRHQL